MRCEVVNRGWRCFLGFLWAAVLSATPFAQAQRSETAGNADLLLEGQVARVFQGSDDSVLYELDTRSVALAGERTETASRRLPAPGDVVYVFVDRPAEVAPQVGEMIRASVRREAGGVWVAAGPNWFKRLARAATDGGGRTMAEHPSQVRFRGMLCKATLVGGRLGLEVQQVDDNSPAQQAGFQVGDVVVAVGDKPLSSAADLEAYAPGNDAVDLQVVDVNTGRLANVTVAGSRSPATVPSTTREADDKLRPAERIANSLGITVESSRAGLRKLVKVKDVTPGSPGAQAGLEPGDQIVQVGDTAVYGIDDLAEQLPARAGVLTLVVRDVRSGRDVPIQVAAAGFAAPQTPVEKPRPAPRANRSTATGDLGITGELTFYDAEAAVKVAAVAPQSPAARAGIRPGMILVSANGKALLHPDDLAKAAADAGGQLSLRVVNPATQRESSVQMNY